jgi:hypothetical protein
VRAGLLGALTRPELDALLAEAEHANQKAQIALTCHPLTDPAGIYGVAGVAADDLALWQDALDESIRRWIAGEMPA